MYYFFLGNTPDLSRLELESLGISPLVDVTDSIVSYDGLADVMSLAPRLGGTRKIAEEKGRHSLGDAEPGIESLIAADTAKNIAVTDYTGKELIPSLSSLKSRISETRHVRFVSMDTSEHELLMLAHQHVAEYNLLPAGEGTVTIAKTVWIFDAEDWVRRDREKPYRDIKRGMLPPKTARMMVNIATRGKICTVYDPFCGTGTVLAEALLTGCTVLGSDNFAPAIDGAKQNLSWLSSVYDLQSMTYDLQVSDVSHPPFAVAGVVVTEPYMGPLQDSRKVVPLEKIKDISRGLDKLYRGAFRAWANLLPPGGRVVMAIPSFCASGRVTPTISVDTLAALGYNTVASVPYGKPGATVIRNITILEKK